jgi:hypothetical protein
LFTDLRYRSPDREVIHPVAPGFGSASRPGIINDMATNTVEVDATPKEVFDILLDPYAYPKWVVGTRGVRRADPDWPEIGSSFHHSVMLAGRDRSEMLYRDENKRLVLKVFARPLAVGIVDIQLVPTSRGTRVTIDETPAPETKLRLLHLVLDPIIYLRNAEGMRRFRRVVEGRTAPPV